MKIAAAQAFDPTKNFVEQQQRVDNSLKTTPLPEVKLQVDSVQTLDQLPEIEENCVVLNQLSSEVLGAEVKSGVKAKLDRALSSLRKPKTGVIGRCIGSTGIGYILSQVQSNLIEAGYITTQVDLPDQDFAQSGELVVRFIPGLIGEVSYDQDSASVYGLTVKPLIPSSVTFDSGDLLDVKVLENSLEQTATTATVRGSQQVTKSKILADRTASIYTIDGKRNTNLYQQKSSSWGDDLWNIPLVVSAGEHTLGVVYTMGGFITRPVDLSFEAKPGASYEVQFVTDIGVGWNSSNTYADL